MNQKLKSDCYSTHTVYRLNYLLKAKAQRWLAAVGIPMYPVNLPTQSSNYRYWSHSVVNLLAKLVSVVTRYLTFASLDSVLGVWPISQHQWWWKIAKGFLYVAEISALAIYDINEGAREMLFGCPIKKSCSLELHPLSSVVNGYRESRYES